MTLSRFYTLAGLRIEVTDTPEVLLEAIDMAFSLSRSEPGDVDIVLKGNILEDDHFLMAMPTRVRQEFGRIRKDSDPVLKYGSGDEITLIFKGLETSGFALCEPPYSRIDLYSQKLSRKPAPLVFKSVMMPIIGELMARRGSVMMHAGCVATPQGGGVLLLADGGGGKTTTAFSMVRAGFHFLSDDLVTAHPGDNDLSLVPIREKINISQQTAGFFPELRSVQKELRKVTIPKLPVDPHDVFPENRIVDEARASVILIIQVAEDGPRLEPLEGSTMLHYLLKSSTFARRSALDQHNIDTIWDLLLKCRLFRLVTGYHPASLGGWLEDNLIQFCSDDGAS